METPPTPASFVPDETPAPAAPADIGMQPGFGPLNKMEAELTPDSFMAQRARQLPVPPNPQIQLAVRSTCDFTSARALTASGTYSTIWLNPWSRGNRASSTRSAAARLF
jgi:hypothetical protein